MGNLLTFVMHFDKNMIEIFTLDHDIKKLTKAVKNDDNDVVEYTDNKYEVSRYERKLQHYDKVLLLYSVVFSSRGRMKVSMANANNINISYPLQGQNLGLAGSSVSLCRLLLHPLHQGVGGKNV